MLGLWKSKKRKVEEEKNDLKAIVTEDLLGKSEWKESKVGYLTGLSSVGRIAGNVSGAVAQSFGRTGLLFKILTSSDDLEALPEPDEENYNGRLRYIAAIHLHRRTPAEVARALRNTWRSFYFFLALDLAAIIWLAIDLVAKDKMAATTFILHISPIPVLTAYAFKAAVTNWTFRNQRLEHPLVFIKSRDWWPKK